MSGKVRFRAMGDWGEEDVIARWVADGRERDVRVEAIIEDAWREAHARPGMKLFDGPMCRLEGFRAGERLELEISHTSYRIFWGTNLNHPEVPAKCRANGIGMSCALESADGALVLGKRSAAVAYYPSRVHPFAGSLEPAENVRVFSEIRRELREELRLADDEIGRMQCRGIIEDAAISQPELVFSARCTLGRQEIGKRLDALEHVGCVWIEADQRSTEHALDDAAMTPVALGTVLLWGRSRFGGHWFDAVTLARNLRG